VVAGDRLWTTSPDGLFVLEHRAWRKLDVSDGFRSAAMAYVLIRADGRVCAAYTEAIGATCFRYDRGAISSLQHIDAAEGLTTGKIYFLGEDRQRRLWVGTGGGVDVISPDGVEHFDEGDGLAGDDAAANAFLSDADGSVWLGSTGGVTHVFAQHYDGPPRPPHAVLLAGKLGDLSIHSGAQARVGDQATTTALEVPHDRSSLRLEFAAGSLIDATRVTYQVRLSPLETEWGTTNLREARYPALLPGAYRFEVRARVAAGAWGPAAALAFRVLPAWWQTRWFLGLAVLAALAALGTGFSWRQRAVLRRRTRQLHEQSDTSFRTVIDGMPDLISVHRDQKLVYLNAASRRFHGVDGAETRLDELDLMARVHPDDRAGITEMFRQVLELGNPHGSEIVEIRMRAADGTLRTCELSGILVEIGGAPTVVASGRDVTERKRMRAKLMVSDRMASLGTLAAGIAHEINNPLAYVTGNLEALAEIVQGSAAAERNELSQAIGDARDGAERVRKIVQGLRSFTRSEEAERTAIALPGVLEAAIRMTANEVRHRAELVCELAPLPLVVADDGELTQVFINLLINAAHAIPEGHSEHNRITVRTRTDDHGRAVIEIEDTGRGIAPDLQSRVFDPFFTTKDVGEGTGLGLSICHGIISGHGGQISIESAPSRGTIVRVVLPAAPAVAEPKKKTTTTAATTTTTTMPAPAPVAAPARPTPAEIAGARRLRVMLVDDEPMVAQTIERLLRRDYDITIASCGQDAIGHISGGARFAAIVSDVMMPNMTGLDLFEELLRAWPDQAARVVFLSGGAFTAQTRDRLDALGAPQLEKPVTAKELRACVMRIAGDAEQAAAPVPDDARVDQS
jgi:PAS domain S-box-containing protein